MTLRDEVEADLAQIKPRETTLVSCGDEVSVDIDGLATQVQVKKGSFAGLIRHEVVEPLPYHRDKVPVGAEQVLRRLRAPPVTLRQCIAVQVPVDRGVTRDF